MLVARNVSCLQSNICFTLFKGMAIKGGSDTPYKNVYVRELREGGAVHKDGFVQVQPAVCQVLSLPSTIHAYL